MHISKVARVLQLEECMMGHHEMELRKDWIKTGHFINAKVASRKGRPRRTDRT